MSSSAKKGKRGLGRRTSSSSSTGSASGKATIKTADLRMYFSKATDTPTQTEARKAGRPLFTPPAGLKRQSSSSSLGSSSSPTVAATPAPAAPSPAAPSSPPAALPKKAPLFFKTDTLLVPTRKTTAALPTPPPSTPAVVPAAAPAAWLDLAARTQVQLKGPAPYDTGGTMVWSGVQLELPTAPSTTTGRFAVVVGRNPKLCDCVIDSDQEGDFKGMSRAHASLAPTENGKHWCITAIGSGAVVVNAIKVDSTVLAHGDVISFPAGAALTSVKKGDAYVHQESDTTIRLYFRLSARPLPTVAITAAQLLYGARVLVADKDGGIEGWGAIEQEGTRDIRVKWESGHPSSTYLVKELLQRVLECTPPSDEVVNALDGAKMLPRKRVRGALSSVALIPQPSVSGSRPSSTAATASKPKKRLQSLDEEPAGMAGSIGKRARGSSWAEAAGSGSQAVPAPAPAAADPIEAVQTGILLPDAAAAAADPALRAKLPPALRELLDHNGRGTSEVLPPRRHKARGNAADTADPPAPSESAVPSAAALGVTTSPSRRSNRDRTGELREQARVDALLRTSDKRNKSGETALHQEVIRNNVELVKTLIGKGASVDVVCLAGWSPLHEACNHGFTEMVGLLIKHGADVNAAANSDAETPLHDAVMNSHLDCAKLLLRAKADVNAITNGGDTPLDFADDVAMVKFLKSKGAKISATPAPAPAPQPQPKPEADAPPAPKRPRTADGKAKVKPAGAPAASAAKKDKGGIRVNKDFATAAVGKGKAKAKAGAQAPKRVQSEPEAYFPEYIMASRLLGGDLQFEIKWFDYPLSDSTWEAAVNVLEGRWRHLQCNKCNRIRVIIENGGKVSKAKVQVQASGFCCSKAKRFCYEPCDEGREAAAKPANPALDAAQDRAWSDLNGIRIGYWDFTDGAELDGVAPRNEFERNAWAMDDWQTSGDDFMAGSEAPSISKPLDDRMGANLALMRSHVSPAAKPHAKHQLWLASLLAGPMKRETGVLQKRYDAQSRTWGRMLSDMLADAAFAANGRPSGAAMPVASAGAVRAEEAWQAFHLVVMLAYVPVDPADTGSAKANQIGAARALLTDLVLRGPSVAALMRANTEGLRESMRVMVDRLMPQSSKYFDRLLDKVAQPLLCEMFTDLPEERTGLMEEVLSNYRQMDVTGKRRFLLSMAAPPHSAGSFKETFLLLRLGRCFQTIKLVKTPAGTAVDRTWQALSSVLQSTPAALAVYDVDAHGELLELASQLVAMLRTDAKLVDAQRQRSPTIVPASWLHRFGATFDRFAKDPAYPGLQLRVGLFIASCDELA